MKKMAWRNGGMDYLFGGWLRASVLFNEADPLHDDHGKPYIVRIGQMAYKTRWQTFEQAEKAMFIAVRRLATRLIKDSPHAE